MKDPKQDRGLMVAVVDRLEKQRLPRAMDLKARVEQGAKLSDFDINFLEEVFKDAQTLQHMVDKYPEWQPLAVKMISLYKEITTKALANEEAG
jgi:hypothetical protein